MTTKEAINYAKHYDFCEQCEHKTEESKHCETCVHKDFWRTVLSTFTMLRKIHKITNK